MWFPGKTINREIRDLFVTALNDEEVKQELSKRFAENLEKERTKNTLEHTSRMDSNRSRGLRTFDELTSGNVDLQTKMAASGYDVYGRTILTGHKDTSHDNLRRKMKNKIQYNRRPFDGYRNRGDSSII